MERHDVPDRQFDALLERLDRIAVELERLNRSSERGEGFVLVAGELRNLNESLNALAYAALGQSPQVRRRASWRVGHDRYTMPSCETTYSSPASDSPNELTLRDLEGFHPRPLPRRGIDQIVPVQ